MNCYSLDESLWFITVTNLTDMTSCVTHWKVRSVSGSVFQKLNIILYIQWRQSGLCTFLCLNDKTNEWMNKWMHHKNYDAHWKDINNEFHLGDCLHCDRELANGNICKTQIIVELKNAFFFVLSVLKRLLLICSLEIWHISFNGMYLLLFILLNCLTIEEKKNIVQKWRRTNRAKEN